MVSLGPMLLPYLLAWKTSQLLWKALERGPKEVLTHPQRERERERLIHFSIDSYICFFWFVLMFIFTVSYLYMMLRARFCSCLRSHRIGRLQGELKSLAEVGSFSSALAASRWVDPLHRLVRLVRFAFLPWKVLRSDVMWLWVMSKLHPVNLKRLLNRW